MLTREFDFKDDLQIGNRSVIDNIGNVIFEINKSNRDIFVLNIIKGIDKSIQILPIEDKGKWRIFSSLEDGVYCADNVIEANGNLKRFCFLILENMVAEVLSIHQLQDALVSFQSKKNKKMRLVFDFETNGSQKSSPLSFGAILIDDDYNVLKTIERFYHIDNNEEKYNFFAAKIHKLSSKKINKIRTEASVKYPPYFKDDNEIKQLFLNNSISRYIGHNVIAFDASVIENKFGISIE